MPALPRLDRQLGGPERVVAGGADVRPDQRGHGGGQQHRRAARLGAQELAQRGFQVPRPGGRAGEQRRRDSAGAGDSTGDPSSVSDGAVPGDWVVPGRPVSGGRPGLGRATGPRLAPGVLGMPRSGYSYPPSSASSSVTCTAASSADAAPASMPTSRATRSGSGAGCAPSSSATRRPARGCGSSYGSGPSRAGRLGRSASAYGSGVRYFLGEQLVQGLAFALLGQRGAEPFPAPTTCRSGRMIPDPAGRRRDSRPACRRVQDAVVFESRCPPGRLSPRVEVAAVKVAGAAIARLRRACGPRLANIRSSSAARSTARPGAGSALGARALYSSQRLSTMGSSF